MTSVRLATTVAGIADLLEIQSLLMGADLELLRLLADLRDIGDQDVREPSTLPGWSRGHVLTHLARNAAGQSKMLGGALRGELAEQYTGGVEARTKEIEQGAGRSARALVEDVEQSAVRLTRLWQQMTLDAWERPTIGAIAGERPAWATLWSRWRELALHHVDLAVGFLPSDWSTSFIERMLTHSTPSIKERQLVECEIAVSSIDAQFEWRSNTDVEIEVRGPSSALVAWITGRPGSWLGAVQTMRDGASTSLPELKPWG